MGVLAILTLNSMTTLIPLVGRTLKEISYLMYLCLILILREFLNTHQVFMREQIFYGLERHILMRLIPMRYWNRIIIF